MMMGSSFLRLILIAPVKLFLDAWPSQLKPKKVAEGFTFGFDLWNNALIVREYVQK